MGEPVGCPPSPLPPEVDTFSPVIRSLRQLRWLAAALLIASPAVGGQALALLHPCPATGSTSVAAAPASAAQAAEHHHDASPAAPSHHHDASQSCTCLGSCHTPAITAAPTSVVASVVPVAAPQQPSWPLVEAGSPVAAAADRLPPTTAPPLV
jgi:hypothetical protein